jgi:hypothetical protein
MKKSFALALIAAVLTAATFSAADAASRVRGYTRNNGTYVAPHMRSSPDRSYNNNWTTRPNVNPYTGQRGTRSPLPYGR